MQSVRHTTIVFLVLVFLFCGRQVAFAQIPLQPTHVITKQDMATWRRLASEYPAEVERAKRAGIPVSLRSLQRTQPPVAVNAAPLYVEMAQILKQHPLGDDEKRLMAYITERAPSSQESAWVKEALGRHSDLMRLIHQATTRKVCVFERNYNVPNPAEVLFPELATTRMATRLLTAESLELVQRGKLKEAVENQALGFQIADHGASDNTLIALLVGVAEDAITLGGLEKILDRSNGDEDVARRVADVLAKTWHPRSLVPAMKFEAAFQQDFMAMVRRKGFISGLAMTLQETSGIDDPTTKDQLKALEAMADTPEKRKLMETTGRWLVDANAAFLLQQMQLIINAADQPFPKANATFVKVEQFLKDTNQAPYAIEVTRLFATILYPSWTAVPDKKALIVTKASVLRAGAAVLAYRAAHQGQLPPTLQTAMTTVPVDPFNGQPLQYRLEPDNGGFVIYSKGKEGNFNGGPLAPQSSKVLRNLFYRWSSRSRLTAH